MRKCYAVMLMVLSVFLITGSAFAVVGIPDNVPGEDVVIPMICSKDGDLNTLWAIANTSNVGSESSKVEVRVKVYDWKESKHVFDTTVGFTKHDIEAWDCKDLIAKMSANQKKDLEYDLDNDGVVDSYVGEVVYDYEGPSLDSTAGTNVFIGWVYYVNLCEGFAAGLNAYSAENGVYAPPNSTERLGLGENEDENDLTASKLYPRFWIHNDKKETDTYWVFLADTCTLNGVQKVITLDGSSIGICNEDEVCVSMDFEIKNLIFKSVKDEYPTYLGTDYPRTGFAVLDVEDVDCDGNGDAGNNDALTILGWSWQKARASTVEGTWDVIHPMHRY